MERFAAKKIRVFRGREAILNILADYKESKLSIKAFCLERNIASATFHNWKKKHSRHTVKPGRHPGFAKLQITSPAISGTPLFAEVNGIKLYQWVTAAYLKELLA